MSGVSLAVAHSSEPERTTKQSPETAELKLSTSKQQEQKAATAAPQVGLMGSLRVIELQLVVFIMVFSASGLVPLVDILFPALTSAYILLLSRFVFPPLPGRASREIFRGGRLFRVYAITGTIVGLFFPLAYVLGGFARGDDYAVRSVTPHLFLLSFQILSENVMMSMISLFSTPVRALVPLLYTVRRIFVVVDWVHDVWAHKAVDQLNASSIKMQDRAWVWFGRSLAVGNLVYFSVNLLGFLIPWFLPKAFEMYLMDSKDDELRLKKTDPEEEGKKPPAMAKGSQSSDKKNE